MKIFYTCGETQSKQDACCILHECLTHDVRTHHKRRSKEKREQQQSRNLNIFQNCMNLVNVHSNSQHEEALSSSYMRKTFFHSDSWQDLPEKRA